MPFKKKKKAPDFGTYSFVLFAFVVAGAATAMIAVPEGLLTAQLTPSGFFWFTPEAADIAPAPMAQAVEEAEAFRNQALQTWQSAVTQTQQDYQNALTQAQQNYVSATDSAQRDYQEAQTSIAQLYQAYLVAENTLVQAQADAASVMYDGPAPEVPSVDGVPPDMQYDSVPVTGMPSAPVTDASLDGADFHAGPDETSLDTNEIVDACGDGAVFNPFTDVCEICPALDAETRTYFDSLTDEALETSIQIEEAAQEGQSTVQPGNAFAAQASTDPDIGVPVCANNAPYVVTNPNGTRFLRCPTRAPGRIWGINPINCNGGTSCVVTDPNPRSSGALCLCNRTDGLDRMMRLLCEYQLRNPNPRDLCWVRNPHPNGAGCGRGPTNGSCVQGSRCERATVVGEYGRMDECMCQSPPPPPPPPPTPCPAGNRNADNCPSTGSCPSGRLCRPGYLPAGIPSCCCVASGGGQECL